MNVIASTAARDITYVRDEDQLPPGAPHARTVCAICDRRPAAVVLFSGPEIRRRRPNGRSRTRRFAATRQNVCRECLPCDAVREGDETYWVRA